jgi:hypothetical protein
MGKRVHVIFTGITGIVRRQDGTGCTVLLQDARKHHCPHVAWLQVEAGARPHVAGGFNLNRREKGDRVAFDLEGFDVSITSDFAPKQPWHFDPTHVLPLGSHCPTTKNCANVLRDPLAGKVPGTIAARMILDHGSMAASWVHPEMHWVWEPAKEPAPAAGAFPVAQEICNTFDIVQEELTIQLRRNDGTHVDVTLQDPGDTGKIEVLIGNTLECDIFPEGGDPDFEDTHVRMYFDLSALPPQHRRKLVATEGYVANPPQIAHRHRMSKLLLPQRNAVDVEGGADEGVWMRVGGANCPPGDWEKV